MKNKPRNWIILTLVLFFLPGVLSAQVTVWSVDFNNGCGSGCVASTYGGWTIVDNVGGVSGGDPNQWFVSCAEEGIVPPGCGSTCIGDASLHIGSGPGGGGDMGASFNETGATNATFRLVVSPTINLSGYTANTLAFDFIAYGSAGCADDRAQLRLSTDNGATWPVGFQYCLTSVCCGACNGYSQGQWTTYTLALPAAFDNNPNVRVGYHWRNNGNGSGTDPSVAIDDPRITTVIAPVELVQFKGTNTDKGINLNWVSAQERMLDRYEVERSLQPGNFKMIGTVKSTGTASGGFASYSFNDAQSSTQPYYYRLRMVDLDGAFTHSSVVRIVPGSSSALDLGTVMHQPIEGRIAVQLWTADKMTADLAIVDQQGKIVANMPAAPLSAGENMLYFDASALSQGVYFLKVNSRTIPKGFDPVDLTRKFVLLN